MEMVFEFVISGFVSKGVNDCIDILKDKIRNADTDRDRKSDSQNLETRIYQVTVDALNEFTKNKYRKQDILYDAAESILKGLKGSRDNYVEAVRAGLRMLVSQVADDICKNFLGILCYEICKDENDVLYKEITLIQQEQVSEKMDKGFKDNNRNHEKTHSKLDYAIEGIDYIKENINEQKGEKSQSFGKIPIENRAEEYAGRWDKNVFLNNFKKRDKNAGVNIKLREIYSEELLARYFWKANDEPLDDLKDLLREYIIDKQSRKMLLILGQPGIGKSTLITWIMANLVEKKDDIFIYQFANDLGSINWQGENALNDIIKSLGLKYDELKNKTLILDGFDEIYVGGDRERILNKLEQELKRRNVLKNFSLIITCRQNYIYNLRNIECDYITLQVWNKIQIDIFCRAYWEKCENKISEDKIQKILENKEILGIPLILYMVLALNIDIETNSSIIDIYDQIFSLKKGSIYDRCYDVEHRINKPEIKEHIHRISQKIAFWMFENNADKAFISQEKFEGICESEMSESRKKDEDMQSNTLIGNFFRLKYCEGEGTDELQFIHRSIYEYFVVVYFYESIYKLKSKEKVAGKLGELLKDGKLSKQILEFLKFKFDGNKKYNLSDDIKELFNIMLQSGMTYHIGVPCENALEREINIFSNMLKIVGLWNLSLGEVGKNIVIYLHCNRENNLYLREVNLSGINLRRVNLRRANLSEADLSEADLREGVLSGVNLRRTKLREADLSETDLSEADLRGADLRVAKLKEAKLNGADLSKAKLSEAKLNGADLSKAKLSEASLRGADLENAKLREADLRGADLIGANLREANLSKANLVETIFDESQVDLLCSKYDFADCNIYIFGAGKIINYKEYCMRKQGYLQFWKNFE